MRWKFTDNQSGRVKEIAYLDVANAFTLLPYDHGVSKMDAQRIALMNVGDGLTDSDEDTWIRLE